MLFSYSFQTLKDKLTDDAFVDSHLGLGYIGYYSSSKASGTFWAGMRGGRPTGHLHGVVDTADGSISGNNISYIYPDMETALLGKFKDGKMQDTQESLLLDLGCDKNGLLFVAQYKTPDLNSPHFYYEQPSNVSFGAGPQGTFDPYEHKWLEIKAANKANMGEGVFTKRDVEPNTLVSSYSGFVYGTKSGEHKIYTSGCTRNVTKSDNDRRHCLKYALLLSARNSTINIPPEFDQAESFIPSMGPKVCFIATFKIYVCISIDDYFKKYFR